MPTRHWMAVIPPALLAVLGGAVAMAGKTYRVGQLTAMGPGFLPVTLGLLLAVIGVGLGFSAFRQVLTSPDRKQDNADRLSPVRFRPLVAVVTGMAFWALVAEWAGLVPATVVLVAVASLAVPSTRRRSILWLALALSAAGYFLFVSQLGVPLSAFGR